VFGGHEAASEEEFIKQDTTRRLGLRRQVRMLELMGGQLAAREEEVAR
jgi:hypothetical protein